MLSSLLYKTISQKSKNEDTHLLHRRVLIMIRLQNNQSDLAKYSKEFFSNILGGSSKKYEKYALEVDSSNFMNLQFLILFLQSIKARTDLSFDLSLESPIKGSSVTAQRGRNEDWARISTYLSCFRESLFKNKPIFDTGRNGFSYSGLQNPTSLSFGRIIPLIPVDYEVYSFLSDRVETAFAPSISKSSNEHFIATCHRDVSIVEDKAGKKRTVKTLAIQSHGELFSKNNAVKVLYEACKRYLFNVDNRSKDEAFFNLFERRIEKYSSHTFYCKVKNITVLSFLIFCAHNRYNLMDGLDNIQNVAREKGKLSKYNTEILKNANLYPDDLDDDEILINAMDMADGLLQLIENTVFHAGEGTGKDSGKNGTGLLSIRIFKKENKSWNDYLHHQYAHYFKGDDNRNRIIQVGDEISGFTKSISSLRQFQENVHLGLNSLSDAEIKAHLENKIEIDTREKLRRDVSFYLEVRLIDHSGKNMCEVFVDNHKGDGNFPFNKDNVKVSTFFDPSSDPADNEQERWRVFNSNSDNVTHHYGLQLFDALLQSVDGCFIAQSIADGELVGENNFYSSSGDQLPRQSDCYFPGTQYSILMPFCKRERKNYSFINTNVEYPSPLYDYTVLDKSHILIAPYISKLIEFGGKPYTTQEQKKSYITELSNAFLTYIPAENNISVFDSHDLNIHNMELFAKSLMQYIAKNKEKEINVAITNCREDTFKQLIRIFAIFYDRTGTNEFMKKTQIYLSSEDQLNELHSKDEFLLAGSNLKDTLVAQIKLDAARGITRESQSGTISFLLDMLERRPGDGLGNSQIKYVPFDLLVKNKNGVSIFERNVLNALTGDVQKKNPGCKISPNHMRIGSKIHVDSFYEALVLFSNNYYTGRFAWLIKDKMIRTIGFEEPSEELPILFIGYETYSEMLLRDLCKLFTNSEYCVFEYGTQDMSGKRDNDKFRHTESLSSSKTYQPVFIVPINSTLSTFNKLEAAFNRTIIEHNEHNIKICDNWKILPNSTYLGVIQTRHYDTEKLSDIEKEFFIEIDQNNGRIKSRLVLKIIDGHDVCQDIYYLFCVQSNWSNPLNCEQCYPVCYFAERPLIETDKTSVIPAQLYGLKDEDIRSGKYNDYDGTSGSIYDLKGYILYGHTYRGLNHFQYYIKTDEYFEYVNRRKGDEEKSAIHLWLEKVKSQIIYSSILHYDIIVCPEHYSNSGFVKQVNDVVFDGASLVIGVDVSKDFRDNFKAKHSDLSNLYSNLSKQSCEAEINFHFVDDTIIHGSSISRVKSLTHSLFPVDAYQNIKIKINIFKSIILLLNRNSSDSIMNYVSGYEAFHSYLNLSISSLRIHDNACVLCQEASDNSRLSYRAALPNLSKRFGNKSVKLSKKNVMSVNKVSLLENESREYLRFVSTHNLNRAYSALGAAKNNKSSVFNALVNEILDGLKTLDDKGIPVGADSLSLLISYINVASMPFISFRKSSREAIFELILILFEIILHNNAEYDFVKCLQDDLERETFLDANDKTEKLEILNCESLKTLVVRVLEIISIKSHHCDLTKALIKHSVALRSNFILRQENIIRLLMMSFNAKFDEQISEGKKECFSNYYLYYIKKLTASGTDEAKFMFIEYMILFGKEYPKETENMESNSKPLSILGIEFIEFAKNYMINSRHSIYGEDITKFTNSLRAFLCHLYIENTQIIYDAAHDFSKGDIPKSEKGRYFLENYYKMLKWNDGLRNEEELSQKLGLLYSSLKKQPENVVSNFTFLSNLFSDLLALSVSSRDKLNPIVGFLTKRKDTTLILEDNFVHSNKKQTIWDFFAISDNALFDNRENSENSENCELEQLIEQPKELTDIINSYIEFTGQPQDHSCYIPNIITLKLGEDYTVIDREEDNNGKIKLLISFPEGTTEYQKWKSVRYILTFRHQLCKQLEVCQKNDLLSEELQNIGTKKQLLKARAGYHAEEQEAEYDPIKYVEQRYCNEELMDVNYGDKEALFGCLMNTVIGRLNIKLLSEDNNYSLPYQNYTNEEMVKAFASVTYLPRIKSLLLCDRDSNPIYTDMDNPDKGELEKYLAKQFLNRVLRKNTVKKETPALIYLVACFAELINSAAKHGITMQEPASQSFKEIDIYIDKIGFLCVKNKVYDKNRIRKDIDDGLKRKKSGISLASICGYFDALYFGDQDSQNENSRVRIIFYDQFIEIGLPLFEEVLS